MWQAIYDTRSYLFWLIIVSLVCLVLERLFTWRKNQMVLRKELWQDIFFLIFNGHYAGLLLATVGAVLVKSLVTLTGLGDSLSYLTSLNLLSG